MKYEHIAYVVWERHGREVPCRTVVCLLLLSYSGGQLQYYLEKIKNKTTLNEIYSSVTKNFELSVNPTCLKSLATDAEKQITQSMVKSTVFMYNYIVLSTVPCIGIEKKTGEHIRLYWYSFHCYSMVISHLISF